MIYTVRMIHKTPDNLRNEFAMADDNYDHRGEVMFTYDPVEDGHFCLKM